MPIDPAKAVRMVLPFFDNRLLKDNYRAVKKDI